MACPGELRIAYVINSLEGGGAASPVPAILTVLRDEGVAVRLLALTRRNGKALPPIEAAGFEVRIRDGGERDHLAATRWLSNEVRDFSATHLWTSLTRATLLGQQVGRRLSLPVVSWQHNAFLKPWNERLLRWRCGASALWVADSRHVADLTATRLGIEPERLLAWSIFRADPDLSQCLPWQPGQPLRLGSLGRLHEAKGYDVLIRALAILGQNGFAAPVEWSIAIAGEGGLRERLLQQRHSAAIGNLDFIGFAARPQEFLAGCHGYIQPSRREGFCIAAHEAMLAGLPAIVSATGEMQHSVRDGQDGYVVPVADAKLLAAALQKMLSDPGRVAAMGRSARQRVLGRFSCQQFAATGREIIQRLRQA